MRLGPARQIKAAIGALDEEGRAFEIPFEHGHEIGPIAKGPAQQPRQRQFALEHVQPAGIARIFEHALLAGAALLDPPYLAAGR